ncbi:VWA domain-containing protein [Nannocystis sp.]|uniref:vWA domain-containing protein n=1 Tax=Nannocystis sp. TaxID=1962667 RepID=UPI0025DB8F63|nr:VWA domain-containing protein [Nannocystis sp.]MBK7827638.1 VWA domain-containing protein [Nannocystis sp.]
MNAPSIAKWILLSLPLCFVGCRTGSTVTPIGGTVDPGQGGGNGALLVQGQGAYEAPPHLFSPRPHPAHTRVDPPAPNLNALPKLVNHIDRCYGGEHPQPIASGPRQPTPKPKPPTGYQGKYKKVQYGSAGGSTAIQPTGSSGGVLGGSSQGYGASAPDPATRAPAPNKPAPPPRKDASDGDSAGKGRASGPAPAAEVSAGMSSPMSAPVATSPAPPRPADKTSLSERSAERKADRLAKKEAREASNRPSAGEAAQEPASASAPMDIAADEEMKPVQLDDPREQYKDWGQAIYLSNDDTMSLSSAQRVIFAIEKFLPLPVEHIRPHELLNYFSFQTAPVAPQDDFSVLADIAPDPNQAGIYNLALAIKGRPVDLQARRNANLTFVVDRSGSMSDEGRMDYLKRGMTKMTSQLKTGDLVNVVLFDHEECTPIENFVVGRDKPEILQKAIDKMKPRGSTDVHLGLSKGYALADSSYQPTYNNRVVLVTDALANTGDTDPRTMSMISKYYDSRKIRLSGVGVGREFNDALLDKLTERGKGAYVFLGSEAEVDAVFGARFISLLETTAMDVHFQLHLPPSLRMNVFYGEESSVVKEDVQAIHYFANTSQLFLSDLMARGGKLRPQDQIMLTIEYEDPETGTQMVEEQAFTLAEVLQEDAFNVRKGRLLIGWADRLALLAQRPQPSGRGMVEGSWDDPEGWQACDTGRGELSALAQGLSDPEANRVLGLWDKFCSRYERPRNPVRRDPVAAPAAWPGARG